MDGINQQDLFVSIALFLLISFVVIFPPPAAKEAGFVIPQIFYSLIKDESFDFIKHHLRRSCITMIVHASLPILYTFGMYFYFFENFQRIGSFTFIQILTRISVTILFIALGYVYYIQINDYENHSIIKTLKKFTTPERNLETIIDQINRECRDFNNFKIDYVGYSKVIVTENWIIKTSMYSVSFIDKNNARAKLIRALDSAIPTETTGSTQRLDVQVESVNVSVNPILIRVYDRQMFNDLRDRLGGEVEVLYGIEFKMSLNDRFVQVFEKQILDNPRYEYNNKFELELCLGCQTIEANVKVDKNCIDVNDSPPCNQCHCKPMWCTNCIARIFASKQNNQNPESWMSGFGECPTCRARFCAFDVCLISESNSTS